MSAEKTTANNQALGWLVLRNDGLLTIDLLIEPWGLSCEMPPGEDFYVYISEHEEHVPQIAYTERFISVYATFAVVYHRDKEVFNFSKTPVPPPKRRIHRA